MNTFRAAIAATAVLVVPPSAYAQVRVITPDSEHVYGADPRAPGQLPDDEALQRQNERGERSKIQREREREIARRQAEAEAESTRLRAERDQAAADYWQNRENARVRDAGGQDNLAFGSRRR
jgi:hypothetical protein